MKRILACLILVLLVVGNAFAEGVDLTAMTDEELLALKSSIDVELSARGVTGSVINSGQYVVGTDIKSGGWVFTNCSSDGDPIIFCMWENEENYHKFEELWAGGSDERREANKYRERTELNPGQSYNFSLNDGEILLIVIPDNGTCIIQEANNSFAP